MLSTPRESAPYVPRRTSAWFHALYGSVPGREIDYLARAYAGLGRDPMLLPMSVPADLAEILAEERH